jgi:hypothetical protein
MEANVKDLVKYQHAKHCKCYACTVQAEHDKDTFYGGYLVMVLFILVAVILGGVQGYTDPLQAFKEGALDIMGMFAYLLSVIS